VAARSMLALAALTLGSCEGDPGIRGEPIRVGVIVSLSGGLEGVGPHLANAARLAAREVNSSGGLLGGRRVEVLVRDDRTDPVFAATVARELIEQDGVVAIVGSLASSASLEAQAVTAAARIPQVSCCSTSPDITTAQPVDDRYLFRTVPSDLLQGVVLAQTAVDLGCTSMAVVHINDSYGNGLAGAITDNFEALGGTVSADIPFTPERPSYATEVEMVATAAPTCAALVAFSGDGGTVLREWDALAGAPDVTWIGTDGVKDASFAESAGSPEVIDGVIGTAPITEPNTPQFNDYAADYEATFSSPSGIFGGNQYDAMAGVLLAIEAAGTTDGVVIRDSLFDVSQPAPSEPFFGPGELGKALTRIREVGGLDYQGASGPIDFDTSGNVVSDYEIWRFDAAAGDFIRQDVIRASEIN